MPSRNRRKSIMTGAQYAISGLMSVFGTGYLMQGEILAGLLLLLAGLAVLFVGVRLRGTDLSLRLGFALLVPGCAGLSQSGYNHTLLPAAVASALVGGILLARGYDQYQAGIEANGPVDAETHSILESQG